MMTFKIASRSIFRNTRRSLMTLLTIAVGTVATLVFGAYTLYVTLGLQTTTVQRTGHLTVYRTGYFSFGSGNPAAWGIDHAQALLQLIRDDPVLKPLTAVATPIQSLAGLAGNFDNDSSKTFFGVGFVPSERDQMKRWNEYGTGSGGVQHSGLEDDEAARGIVGVGLARILGLCERLHLDPADCPPAPEPPKRDGEASPELASVEPESVAELAERDRPSEPAEDAGEPRIDLLAATAGGAPNVVSLAIHRVEYQGFKELDDNYIGMNLTLAQQLVYGRGEHKVTGIVLQLHRTEDQETARARLVSLFKDRGLDLEVRDFTDITPFYKQSIGLFRSIFSFISVIIGVVVLFTVVNAMGMSVMERIDEIGTIRAMGVRRAGIRRQFLLEGCMLGVLGASLGVVLAFLVAYAVNSSGLTWTPPSSVRPIPLRLYMVGAWALITGIWVGLVAVSTLAALIPANRAAKMAVVDALRHV
jgi:putative ABC transport system permease protein